MKRITLPIVLLAIATAAAAQTPPTPPAPATPMVPAPAPAARPLFARPMDAEDVREQAELMREQSARMREDARIQNEEFTRTARENARMDAEMARENARAMVEQTRSYAMSVPALAPIAPLAPLAPVASVGSAFYYADRIDRVTVRAPWAPGDPADSLYRVARDLFSRGDWGRAARMFSDITKNYSKSAYATDALYYEAYARYKIGTTDELRAAAKILEPLANNATNVATGQNNVRFLGGGNAARRTNDSEIVALYARINGVLAQRGDSDAAAKVAKAAQALGGNNCDREDIAVRTEALNALSQMDPAQALPLLRRVVDRKDECSAELRRNAVFILGRRADNESAQILLAVAKNDPNSTVRMEAINYLSRLPGDVGINALEDILRTEQDERIQASAVRSLMASDNTKARASMRALIDRKDAPMRLRVEAINSFNADRSTADDASYLRGLYGKADGDQIKNAIVNAVSRIGGAENDQWVIGIARNANESSSVRSNALSRLSRSPTITTADLVKLYDASAESYDVRNRIISLLGNRKDQEATDKLVDIVRNSTVINNRMSAINALRSKNDPRAAQLLMDILDGKKP